MSPKAKPAAAPKAKAKSAAALKAKPTTAPKAKPATAPKAKKKPAAPKRAPGKKKAEAAKDNSASIEALTADFLQKGGKVDVIPSGVSGQQSMAPGRKHITLGNHNKQGA